MPKAKDVAIAGGAFLLGAAVGVIIYVATAGDDERAPIRVKNGKLRVVTDTREWSDSPDGRNWKVDHRGGNPVSGFVVTAYNTDQQCVDIAGTKVDVTYQQPAGTHTVTVDIDAADNNAPRVTSSASLKHTPGHRGKLQLDLPTDPDASLVDVRITAAGGASTQCTFQQGPGRSSMLEVCMHNCQ